MFLSNPQPFTAAVTHKSYFNHSMQKAASAYEAREKICGKASCMACSRAEITAQLQVRGPRGRETLPAQAKQEDDSDLPREKARKIPERMWKTGTESLLNFCSNQFRLPSERFLPCHR